jgi:hypothetical protein
VECGVASASIEQTSPVKNPQPAMVLGPRLRPTGNSPPIEIGAVIPSTISRSKRTSLFGCRTYPSGRRFPRFTVAPGVPSIPLVPTCNLLTACERVPTVPCRDASRRNQGAVQFRTRFRERSLQRNALPSSRFWIFFGAIHAYGGLEATVILCLGVREVLLRLETASSGKKTAKEGTNAVNHGVVALRGSRCWPSWCH